MKVDSRILLVKWGGSLITDKSGNEAVRHEVLRSLAAELGTIRETSDCGLVLGHGSGSFGHQAAAGGGWKRAGKAPDRGTLSSTQDAAARLHRAVVAALLQAGLAPFSIAPGSFITADGSSRAELDVGPFELAVKSELLPVTFGDVVLSSDLGARIFSTEQVFLSIAPQLLARGYRIGGVYWMGTTDGILDSSGATIEEIDSERAASVSAALAQGDAGEGVADVTGGMKHRLDAALAFAALGIPSWIIDGRSPGALSRALGGGRGGTRVVAGGC